MSDIEIIDLPAAANVNASDLLHIRQGSTDKKAQASLLADTLGLDSYLEKDQNLADLTNEVTARNNLGLQSGATTTVGTVATRDVGESATQIPDMSSFLNTIAKNGSYRLPGGLIVKWGEHFFGDIGGAFDPDVTFPEAFPNECFIINIGQVSSSARGWTLYVERSTITSAGFSLVGDEWLNYGQAAWAHYIAIGR